MSIKRVIICALFVAALCPSVSLAYEPLAFELAKDVPAAGTVFVGRVVSIRELEPNSAEAEIRVLEVYKGLSLNEGDSVYVDYNLFTPCDYPHPCIDLNPELGTEVLFVIREKVDSDRFRFDIFFQDGIDFALTIRDKGHYDERYLSTDDDMDLELRGINCIYYGGPFTKNDLRKLSSM